MGFPNVNTVMVALRDILRAEGTLSHWTVEVGPSLPDLGNMPWVSILRGATNLEAERIAIGAGPFNWDVGIEVQLFVHSADSPETAEALIDTEIARLVDVLHDANNRTLTGTVLFATIQGLDPVRSTGGEFVAGVSFDVRCRVQA